MRKILFIIFILSTIFVRSQNLYVVSVGICDYKESQMNDLRYTEADVASFNKVVKTHTKEVYTLVGSQATHANVYNYINQVFVKATENDVVMLFFSGHGYPGGFCCYDMSNHGGGLSYSEIASLFRKCKAKRKMVFADACYSGGLRSNKKESETNVSDIRKGDVMFFLSSRTNETSIEMGGGPNGIFTRFLVRGMEGGADENRDKIISAKELYDFVHNGVSSATGNKQHPVMWGRFNNTMSVISWNKK